MAADGVEMFIGLVGPCGTELGPVIATIETTLSGLKTQPTPFRVETIDVIKTLERVKGFRKVPEKPPDRHISGNMDHGDRFRRETEMKDALACNAISAVREARTRLNKSLGTAADQTGAEVTPVPNVAYIFKSLKTPQEVQTLRETYRGAFFLISCYSSKHTREDSLRRRIDRGHVTPPQNLDERVTGLIKRDYRDESEEFGQNVRSAFPKADLFLDLGNETRAKKSIERFLKLIFSHPYLTPNNDEYAMFLAFSAALKSADLGRQVGAVITSRDGDVLTIGWNEVPKFGGGVYGEDDTDDHRDFRLGHDSSSKWKRRIVYEIAKALHDEDWLKKAKFDPSADEFEVTNELLRLLNDKGARVVQLIEFLRPVHAEMAAITQAARTGISLKGTTLYCTTFPCHECTRLIVASGITRVVYVDPYPKSLADHLYQDSVIIDPSEDDLLSMSGGRASKVIFQQFVGVAPRMYFQYFKGEEDQRKDSLGQAFKEADLSFEPKFDSDPRIYTSGEEDAFATLRLQMESAGLAHKG